MSLVEWLIFAAARQLIATPGWRAPSVLMAAYAISVEARASG